VQREDAVFRALADPSRRAILERLSRGEAPVKDLTARFGWSHGWQTHRGIGPRRAACAAGAWHGRRDNIGKVAAEDKARHP